MNILFFHSAFAMFFLQISTLCLYPFWNSLSLSNSSCNIAFSFSLVTDMFFRVFTSKVKFPIFKITIAMVWNNLATLYAFIISIVTSSIDFGVLVYVVGSPDPAAYDPNSCTIIIPSSNSNGNPSIGFGLLGGTYSYVDINSSKTCCVTTLYVYNSVACRPSCVCCCCKCWKCFGLPMVSIQSSHTSLSKYRCSSPFGNLMSCSLLTPYFAPATAFPVAMSFVVFLPLFPWLYFMWRCHMW